MMKRIMSLLLVLAMTVGMCVAVPVHAAEEEITEVAPQLSPSEEMIEIIKRIEGFAAIPYWDHSQWTVGFGSKCPEEDMERYKAEGIPVEEADRLLRAKLNGYGKGVSEFAREQGLELSQHQFDALVSFTYNLGSSWMSDTEGSMYKAVVEGYTGNQFIGVISAYCNAGGEYMGGLMRRRLAEANIYLNGEYGTAIPSNYGIVKYDANGGTRSCSAQGFDCNLLAQPRATAIYEGYEFQGWFTEPEGGMRVTELSESLDGMTLYAHWIKSDEALGKLPEPVEVKVTGDMVILRNGPAVDYDAVKSVPKGTVLNITHIQDGWGKCEFGWIILRHTDYVAPEVPDDGSIGTDKLYPELPFQVTVITTEELYSYNGPHATYPKRELLKNGQTLEILELFDMVGTTWGRYEGGWVRMTKGLMIGGHKQLAHGIEVTVVKNNVTFRTGPDMDFEKLGYLENGQKITVISVLHIGATYWGRHETGWSRLDSNTDFAPEQIPSHEAHEYGDWYLEMEASCFEPGRERRDCATCDAFETRPTELKAHTYDQWFELIAPTGTEQGLERRDCVFCDEYELRSIEISQHVFGEWEETLAPTCDQKGQLSRGCAHCDLVEIREIAALGHVYGPWEEVTAPKCTEDGLMHQICYGCGGEVTKPIPMTGHIYENWEQVKAPTCTEAGEEVSSCVGCQLEERREVEALPHAFGKWEEVKKPTCAEPGENKRVCADCGFVESKAVEMLSHSFGAWEVHVAATTTENGILRRYCKRCDHYEEQIVLASETFEVVITCHSLSIRSGAGKSYDRIGFYHEGDKVRILEQKQVGTATWGKTLDGWICLTGYTAVVEEGEPPVVIGYATITCKALSIRENAGKDYDRVGFCYEGDRLELLEVEQVGEILWGRTSKGWICLTGYANVEMIEKTE